MCESSVATTAELSASGSSHKSLTNRNCLQRLFDFLFHHLTMGNCGGKTKKGPPDADGDNSVSLDGTMSSARSAMSNKVPRKRCDAVEEIAGWRPSWRFKNQDALLKFA